MWRRAADEATEARGQGRWAPDPLFAEVGASGEVLVARVRLALVTVLLAIQLVPGTQGDVRRVTLPLTLVALLLAALFYRLALHRGEPWLGGFGTSAADVTLVSCGLAAFLLLDQPLAALNSRTLFEVYFLAIGCASLRYNPQACALTGLLALAQYAVIVLYAASRWNLHDPRFAPFRDGMFDWHAQGMRVILLGAAALLSALIVMRARSLRSLSHEDRLTGVANRRAFEERLGEEWSRARRHGRPFAVAVVDVDHFKAVNDAAGHAAGDLALRSVARVLTRGTRQSDLVARLGGDEFALLLPETTAELVMGRLETLRAEVAATPLPWSRGPRRLTLSAGVASWPDDGAQVEQVLAAADARLYQAKRLGRDRVVGPAWQPDPAASAALPPDPVS
jgi:diguanylate cyclase (GGDEF)-like protein